MRASIDPSPKRLIAHCTNHCSQCGRHFHSLDAFDSHLTHEAIRGGWPQCLDPERDEECLDQQTGLSRFTALTTNGSCEMYVEAKKGVTIWTLQRNLERTRAQWRSVQPSGGDA